MPEQIIVPAGIASIHNILCGCIDREGVWKEFRSHLERNHAESKDKPTVEFTSGWYLFECVLEENGLCEHGTSIRFAWLTDKGREALAFLKCYGDGWSDRTDIEFLDDKECWLNPP